ncbi:hypothetical protein AKG08_17265 [Achromobacter piechaudii]|uniref:hypothetical protein n=1 Tax=Achromobacter piechaudii TaxID=72556 RepID=UPI00067FF464|nr:hypothetical protein [Achromobacter piechaudii]KNY09398.1 hypothetical protein AKG08_17265 [Achromobacter piechaudii]
MTDHTTTALADNKEIRSGFELCYAVDADDPANVSDLGHFTNGWRACIMSQVRAPVADERAVRIPVPFSVDTTHKNQAFVTLGFYGEALRKEFVRAVCSGGFRFPTDSVARAPVANEMPIRLSTEVLEYLKEGIENATGCEDSDVDHDFANELERLMTGPLYTKPLANYPEVEWGPLVVAPVSGEAQRPHLNIVLDHAADRLAEAGMRDDACIVRGMKVPNDGSKTEPINAAPQASEAVRILFPTHLRKMWSGGEVQAWLDERQGISVPQAEAKGSFGRYRKWLERKSDLKDETVQRSQEKSNER